MKTNKELMREAKNQLKGKWLKPIAVSFIAMFILISLLCMDSIFSKPSYSDYSKSGNNDYSKSRNIAKRFTKRFKNIFSNEESDSCGLDSGSCGLEGISNNSSCELDSGSCDLEGISNNSSCGLDSGSCDLEGTSSNSSCGLESGSCGLEGSDCGCGGDMNNLKNMRDQEYGMGSSSHSSMMGSIGYNKKSMMSDYKDIEMMEDKGLFSSLFNLLFLLIIGPLLTGYILFYLNFSRSSTLKETQLFDGFGKGFFVRSIIANFLRTLLILLWSILLIVPGIIAALRLSLTFYILADDKEIQPIDAMSKSKELMLGHKSRLFRFILRFTGWFILSILTLGIGFLWLHPYFRLSLTKFYEEVKNTYNKGSTA